MKRNIAILALLALCAGAGAQSKGFTLGKWTEIQSSILKELNRSYVDSLPIDRIERAGVNAMLGSLDPYTVYIPQEENENLEMMIKNTYGGIGAVIYKPDTDGNVIINEPYEGSPAAKNGLQCGDEILAIDGVSVHGLTSSQASEKMRGEAGTKVVFTVRKLRTQEVQDITIVREKIHLPDVQYAGMLDKENGYILLSGFSEGVAKEIRSEVMRLKKECGMKKLYLDLRGNGGGLLGEAVDIVSIFVPKGTLVVTAKGKDRSSNYECRTGKDPVDVKIPLVVLIDSSSASASEIVSGALQDLDRATIMGTRSYGKGLVQSIRDLPYGGQLKVTTAKYYTPSGRCVQAIDYSNRNEDGSVGHIPDSLTHEFKTAGGRIVRDGGGITPDIEIKPHEYSRLTYSLVAYGVIEQYALEYVRGHESIPATKDFHFTDAEYENFIEFAKGKEFDYRSSARAYVDQARAELKRDGLEESVSAELEALSKSLDMDKETFLRLKKDEIIPFIEEEIAVRYYFQKAGIEIEIRYDSQLKEALNK
ncbi:MAG: S41 family peptidase [Bacteroidales bacterium]|nr:S41 family peptidase [Candidatus Cryptobacteroides choladohippi]